MATAVGTLAAVVILAACAEPRPAEPRRFEGAAIRVVPALSLTLARPAGPTDRQLHLRVAMSALADPAQPVDRVDVQRDGAYLRLQVWIRERTPRPDEPVPNTAVVRERVVSLDQPVGDAVVVDASTRPPRPVRVATK